MAGYAKGTAAVVASLTALALLVACSGKPPILAKGGEASASTAVTQLPEQETAALADGENPAETFPAANTEPEMTTISSTDLEAVSISTPEASQEETATENTNWPEPWEWSFDTPESQRMKSSELSALHATYDSFPLLSAVIVRNGVVVDTYCKDGYDESSVFTLQSTSKSITGALVGISIEQGYIESVNVPLSEYFPELLSVSDSRWSRITIRHLLTHTSGIASVDSPLWYEWRESEDWLAYLFALPIYWEPGTYFDYSTGNTHLLSAVLERATGKPLGDYAQEVLFGPLDIVSAGVGLSPDGVGDGGNGISMTTLDLARFGLLYLNGGVWQDQQIVSANWVETSTTTQAVRSSDGSRYGYQWWVRSFDGHSAYVAQGHYGQYLIVVPDLSLLIAINSDYEGSSSIYWRIASDVIAACE